jgi:hypothetical protein
MRWRGLLNPFFGSCTHERVSRWMLICYFAASTSWGDLKFRLLVLPALVIAKKTSFLVLFQLLGGLLWEIVVLPVNKRMLPPPPVGGFSHSISQATASPKLQHLPSYSISQATASPKLQHLPSYSYVFPTTATVGRRSSQLCRCQLKALTRNE